MVAQAKPIDREKLQEAVGLVIRAMREARGLLQRELGAKVGVGEVCQCQREAGRRELRVGDLIAYEEAFNIAPGQIMVQAAAKVTKDLRAAGKARVAT